MHNRPHLCRCVFDFPILRIKILNRCTFRGHGSSIRVILQISLRTCVSLEYHSRNLFSNWHSSDHSRPIFRLLAISPEANVGFRPSMMKVEK